MPAGLQVVGRCRGQHGTGSKRDTICERGRGRTWARQSGPRSSSPRCGPAARRGLDGVSGPGCPQNRGAGGKADPADAPVARQCKAKTAGEEVTVDGSDRVERERHDARQQLVVIVLQALEHQTEPFLVAFCEPAGRQPWETHPEEGRVVGKHLELQAVAAGSRWRGEPSPAPRADHAESTHLKNLPLSLSPVRTRAPFLLPACAARCHASSTWSSAGSSCAPHARRLRVSLSDAAIR